MYHDIGQIGPVDSYCGIVAYNSNGTWMGFYGVNPGATVYNSEGGAGTFLTFGGNVSIPNIGVNTTISIFSFINYGSATGYTAYIKLNGTDVSTIVHTGGEQYAFYAITCTPGASYTINCGIRY